MVLPANLAVQQVNDATPGTVPKLAGGSKLLRANSDGSAAEWVDAATVGIPTSAVTLLPFTVPAAIGNVTVTADPIGFFVAGAPLYIAGAGAYTVASVGTSTVDLTNTGASGNATPGTVIGAGAQINSSGVPGAAGATGSPGTPGKGLAPINYVQTKALPAGSYSAGVYTVTANGALDTTYFDGVAPSLGDSVEIGIAGTGLTATSFGVYTVTQLGDSTHQPKFTRRTDLDSSADFVGGASYEVLGGATKKGGRRYLTTTATITLDTTALAFDDVREQNRQEIDLTKPPYNIVPALGAPALSVGYEDALAQAIYDASTTRKKIKGPHGYVTLKKPVKLMSGVDIDCISTTFCDGSLSGSPFFFMGEHSAPDYAAAQVDEASGATAIKLWHATDTTKDPLLDLSQAMGKRITGANAFAIKSLMRFEALVSGATHIVSCRGSVMANDTVDTCWSLSVSATGFLTGKLRISSATKLIQAGTSPAVTITAGGVPADENFVLKCSLGGTVGTAKFVYSRSGGKTWQPIEFTSAATVDSTVTDIGFLSKFGQAVTFAFAAGTYNAGDTWTNNQTATVTSGSAVTPGTALANNYLVALVWDGSPSNGGTNTLTLYQSPRGAGSWTSVGTASFALDAASVNQYIYEEAYAGASANSRMGGSFQDAFAAHVSLGSLRIAKVVGLVSGAIPTTIGSIFDVATDPTNAGLLFYCRPGGSGSEAKLELDGTTSAFKALAANSGATYLMWQRFSGGTSPTFDTFASLSGAQFYVSGSSTGRQGIFLGPNVSQCRFARLIIGSGLNNGTLQDGIYTRGNVIENHWSDVRVSSSRYDLMAAGEFVGHGNIILTGTGIPLAVSAGGFATFRGWLNFAPNGRPHALIALGDANAFEAPFTNVDAEANNGYALAGFAWQMQLSQSAYLGGVWGFGIPAPYLYRGANSQGPVLLDGLITGSKMERGLVQIADTTGPPVVFGSRSLLNNGGTTPVLCTTAGQVTFGNGRLPKGADITATGSITYDHGSVREINTDLGAGTHTVTLGAANVVESQEITVKVNTAQTAIIVFANGGTGGGNLYTLPLGTKGWIRARFDGVNWGEPLIGTYT